MVPELKRPPANLPVGDLRLNVQGPFTKKMLRRGQFAGKHFDDDVGMSFVQLDEDPVTRKPVSAWNQIVSVTLLMRSII